MNVPAFGLRLPLLLLGLGLLLAAAGILALRPTDSTTASHEDPDLLDHVTDLDSTSTKQGICAVTIEGETEQLLCWGINNAHQIGDNTDAPVAVAPVTVCKDGRWESNGGTSAPGCYANGGTPSPFIDIDKASGGADHACVLTLSDNVWCWGSNGSGQLGDNSNMPSFTPVQVCNSVSGPVCDGYLGNVVELAAGYIHHCALTSVAGEPGVNELWCWGEGGNGQQGDGSLDDNLIATKVTSVSDVRAVSTGYGNTCAIVGPENAAMCWGLNVGIGDGFVCQPKCDHPVDVCALGETGPCSAASGNNLVDVTAINAAGLGRLNKNSCAVLDEGEPSVSIVACWGDNAHGQLGDGSYTQRLTPVRVCASGSGATCGGDVLENAVDVAGGWYHTCALVNVDEVKCWGEGDDGQLGDNDEEIRNHPVDVCEDALCEAVLDGVVEIVVGFEHSCARLAGGTVKCWGRNKFGEIGDGTNINRHTPVDVVRDTDRDGCTDEAENLNNESMGGNRNPNDYWDFFDVWTHPPAEPLLWERNRVLNMFDILAVAMRFSPGPALTKQEALAEALSEPSDDTSYHAGYDRGPIIGANNWDRGPPDGSINIVDDVLGVAGQFGHSCL